MIKVIILLLITVLQILFLITGGNERVYIASHDSFLQQHESEIKSIISEYTDNFSLNKAIILKAPLQYFYPYFYQYYFGKQDIYLRHSRDDKFLDFQFIIDDKSEANHYNEISDNTVLVYNLNLADIKASIDAASYKGDSTYKLSEFQYPDNQKISYSPYKVIGYTNDAAFLKIYNDIRRGNYTDIKQIPYNYYECKVQYDSKIKLLLMFMDIKNSHEVDIDYGGKLADILVIASIPVSLIIYIIIISGTLRQMRKRKMRY